MLVHRRSLPVQFDMVSPTIRRYPCIPLGSLPLSSPFILQNSALPLYLWSRLCASHIHLCLLPCASVKTDHRQKRLIDFRSWSVTIKSFSNSILVYWLQKISRGKYIGERSWRSDQSAHLPPMWPGFSFSPVSYAGWVCFRFSTCPEGFLRVLRFSSLHKNQYFQIPLRPG